MTATWWIAGALLAFGCSCSPYGGGAFACTSDSQCTPNGVCAEGFCAFPDPACMSGYKFGELSGPKSGVCVGDTQPTVDASGKMDSAPSEGGGSMVCYGAGLVMECFATAPTGARAISAAIDTDNTTTCNGNAMGDTTNCVIAANTITVTGTVTVTGSRPLVLVAVTTIDVQGSLDASSHRTPSVVGAASASGAACPGQTAPGTSGGGAGGSFGGKGGNGGGTNATATAGGVSGTAVTAPTTLRGGCAGQNGNGGMAGAGGPGGGALYLIANTSISVTGSLLAEGAAGANGVANISGAGGGGAGGYIGLDAPTITNNGIIAANPGGGAEGSGQSTAGAPGNEPVGAGGAAASSDLSGNGGNGGDGAVGATLTGGTGANGTATGGGGGGGGGAGIIKRYRAASIGGAGAISPPAT